MRKLILISAALVVASIFQSQAQSNALNFDGVDDHVITTFFGPSGSQARTVEAWIRTTANTDPTNGGRQHVITDWGNMATGARFTLNLLFSNGIRIEVQGSGLSSTTPLNDGLWHHVAAVYDPSLMTNQFKLYVDGLLDTAANLPTPVNTSSINALQLGRRLDGIHNFGGDIDEVRCWNVALSAGDILSSYNKEFCNPPSGLVAYYKMNSGMAGGNNATHTTLFDEINSNNGVLQNFNLFGNTSNWVAGAVSTPILADTIQVAACGAYTSPGGITITSSGVVVDTLVGTNGCDSLFRQEVTIDQVNTSVVVQQFTLISQATAATAFQWLDCDSGFAPISGATQGTFMPTSNGRYAVVVTEGNCTDTSDCYVISGLATQHFGNVFSLQISPNPTNGLLEIHTPMWLGKAQWWVTDVQGKRVAEGSWFNSNSLQISFESLSAGQYIFTLQSDQHAPQHARFLKK